MNAAWTAPISTTLSFQNASQLQLWAPWDRDSAKSTNTWVDPLLPSDGGLGWWTGSYYYGNIDTQLDTIVAPMATVLHPAADAAVTLLLDPTDVQLELQVGMMTVHGGGGGGDVLWIGGGLVGSCRS